MQGTLLDSDYVIALSIHTESTHERAKALRQKLLHAPQYMLRIISYELVTVLSRKQDHHTAIAILDFITAQVQLLDITTLEPAIWQEFRSYTRKSTSFFDCANLVGAKHFGLKIASFDTFYPKSLRAG